MLVYRSIEGILGDNQIGKTATQLIKALEVYLRRSPLGCGE